MILFNQELGEKDCEFNIDSNTKTFLVSFFGFYPHNLHEDLMSFLKELGMNHLSDYSKNEFKLNKDSLLEAYNVCDRRTFDLAIIVPTVFSSKNEALDWFNDKLKNTQHIRPKDICEIDILDGDKLITWLDKRIVHLQKVEQFELILEDELEQLKNNLLQKYCTDKDYSRLIQDKFNRLN
jgi:hypothetical protein